MQQNKFGCFDTTIEYVEEYDKTRHVWASQTLTELVWGIFSTKKNNNEKKNGSSHMEDFSVNECKQLIDIASYSVLKQMFLSQLNWKYPEILRRDLRNLLP